MPSATRGRVDPLTEDQLAQLGRAEVKPDDDPGYRGQLHPEEVEGDEGEDLDRRAQSEHHRQGLQHCWIAMDEDGFILE